MAAFPSLKAMEAAKALAAYLDQAGIVRTEDRISELRRHYAITWLDMLRIANKSIDIVDILDGRELLIAQMRIAEEQ